jgi:hypothetical protein
MKPRSSLLAGAAALTLCLPLWAQDATAAGGHTAPIHTVLR